MQVKQLSTAWFLPIGILCFVRTKLCSISLLKLILQASYFLSENDVQLVGVIQSIITPDNLGSEAEGETEVVTTASAVGDTQPYTCM